jgi:hypothetical protein
MRNQPRECHRPMDHSRTARPRALGHVLGLGQDFPSSTWVGFTARLIPCIQFDPMVARHFRRTKLRVGSTWRTLAPFLISPIWFPFAPRTTQVRHLPPRPPWPACAPTNESEEGCATVGPLSCARVHRWVDTLPSSSSSVGLYSHAPSWIEDQRWFFYPQHRLLEMRWPWWARARRERFASSHTASPHCVRTLARWRWWCHHGPFSLLRAPDLLQWWVSSLRARVNILVLLSSTPKSLPSFLVLLPRTRYVVLAVLLIPMLEI